MAAIERAPSLVPGSFMRGLILLSLLSCSPIWASSGAHSHGKPKLRPRPNQEKFAKLYRSIITLEVAQSDQNVRVIELQRMATEAKIEAAVSNDFATTEIEREFVGTAASAANDAEKLGHELGEVPSESSVVNWLGRGLKAAYTLSLKDDIATAIAIYRGDPRPPRHDAEVAGILYDAMKGPPSPPPPPPLSRPGEDSSNPLDFSASPFRVAKVMSDPALVRACEKVDDLETTGGTNEDGAYACRDKWIRYSDRDHLFSLMGGCRGADIVLVTGREENRLKGVAYRCQQPNP